MATHKKPNPYENRQAHSTNKGKEYAKVVFDKWQNEFRQDPSFDELCDVHVEGDNLEHMLCGYGDYLRLNDILQNNNTGKFQSPQTKAKLFERAKSLFCLRFKNHDCWSDESWYQSLRKHIEEGSTRQEFETGEDSYKDPTVRPVYSRIGDPAVLGVRDRLTPDWQDAAGLDLTSILQSLIKSATSKNRHCEQRIVILITFLGLGRGGESKFLRYDEWYWDPLLELIDAIWAQMKTLEKWPTTFGPDYRSHVLCFYHAFHCFFLVDDGLYRSHNQH
jgi:hypothetical protein